LEGQLELNRTCSVKCKNLYITYIRNFLLVSFKTHKYDLFLVKHMYISFINFEESEVAEEGGRHLTRLEQSRGVVKEFSTLKAQKMKNDKMS